MDKWMKTYARDKAAKEEAKRTAEQRAKELALHRDVSKAKRDKQVAQRRAEVPSNDLQAGMTLSLLVALV